MKTFTSFSLLNYVLKIFTTSLVLIVGISGVNDTTDLDDDNDGILDAQESGGNPLLNSDIDGTPDYLDSYALGYIDSNSITDRFNTDLNDNNKKLISNI